MYKLQTFDLGYFLGKTFFCDNCSQIYYVNQPLPKSLILKNLSSDEYATGWKSKSLYDDEIISRNFNRALKETYFTGFRLAFEFSNSVIAQKNITHTCSKHISLYIVHEIDNWPRNLLNNFILKNCLFGAVKIARNTVKRKFVYNGYRLVIDGASSWNFRNEFCLKYCEILLQVILQIHIKRRINI